MLELSPATGFRMSYKDCPSQQSRGAFQIFKEFLSEYNFGLILELGTGAGGFTLFLSEHKPSGCRLLSWDITDRRKPLVKESPNIEFSKLDVCSPAALMLASCQLANCPRALILCDNGSKIAEFTFYARILRAGDFIGAHDYAPDWHQFQAEIRSKYWDSCEITDWNIKDTISSCSLDNYQPELFNKAAWCMFKKS